MTFQKELDLSEAINYHYDAFPPSKLDYEQLIPKLTSASAALARYDALLRTLLNSEVLLAPLRRREAVISSRIEGTITTVEELFKYEAEKADDEHDRRFRSEVIEVFSYARAMSHAQSLLDQGLPLSGRLLRESHGRMLFLGRGADKQPGQFKSEQNYIFDQVSNKIRFVPCNIDDFNHRFKIFEEYINNETIDPLIQTALAHAEFEALHPFKDGNGRVGRMLITLMLWNKKLISEPHFYVSACIEDNKEEYISKLRAISSDNQWNEWCEFFLDIIAQQAYENIEIVQSIRDLYEAMKENFREITGSKWYLNALDFVFENPVFRNSAFTKESGMPAQTAHRISRLLADNNIITLLDHSSGRKSALYAFEPLIGIASDRK